jgi:hypothetical protein
VQLPVGKPFAQWARCKRPREPASRLLSCAARSSGPRWRRVPASPTAPRARPAPARSRCWPCAEDATKCQHRGERLGGRMTGRSCGEQRNELASFQLTEMHPIPHGPGAHCSISDCSRSVSVLGLGGELWCCTGSLLQLVPHPPHDLLCRRPRQWAGARGLENSPQQAGRCLLPAVAYRCRDRESRIFRSRPFIREGKRCCRRFRAKVLLDGVKVVSAFEPRRRDAAYRCAHRPAHRYATALSQSCANYSANPNSNRCTSRWRHATNYEQRAGTGGHMRSDDGVRRAPSRPLLARP